MAGLRFMPMVLASKSLNRRQICILPRTYNFISKDKKLTFGPWYCGGCDHFVPTKHALDVRLPNLRHDLFDATGYAHIIPRQAQRESLPWCVIAGAVALNVFAFYFQFLSKCLSQREVCFPRVYYPGIASHISAELGLREDEEELVVLKLCNRSRAAGAIFAKPMTNLSDQWNRFTNLFCRFLTQGVALYSCRI